MTKKMDIIKSFFKKEKDIDSNFIDIKDLYWYYDPDTREQKTLHLAVRQKGDNGVKYFDFETNEEVVNHNSVPNFFKPFAIYNKSHYDCFIIPIKFSMESYLKKDNVYKVYTQGFFDKNLKIKEENIITNYNWETKLYSKCKIARIGELKLDVVPFIKFSREMVKDCLIQTRRMFDYEFSSAKCIQVEEDEVRYINKF